MSEIENLRYWQNLKINQWIQLWPIINHTILWWSEHQNGGFERSEIKKIFCTLSFVFNHFEAVKFNFWYLWMTSFLSNFEKNFHFFFLRIDGSNNNTDWNRLECIFQIYLNRNTLKLFASTSIHFVWHFSGAIFNINSRGLECFRINKSKGILSGLRFWVQIFYH